MKPHEEVVCATTPGAAAMVIGAAVVNVAVTVQIGVVKLGSGEQVW
jgi:hypothetical protein